jgi:PAS domain S-box-containing protein
MKKRKAKIPRKKRALGKRIWKKDILLEKIFSCLQIHIAYLDPEFNFVRVNASYAQVAGHNPEFFIGKNHFDLYPDEENEKIFRNVLKSGESYTAFAKPFEYLEQPEVGVTYWDWNLQSLKDEKGNVEGLILSLVDVTAREKALEDYGRLAAAIENTEEHIIIVDNQSIIRYGSPAFLNSLGLKKEELVGKKSDVFLIGQYSKQIYDEMWSSIDKGLVWSGQYRKKREKGVYTDFAITAYPMKDEKGNIRNFTVIERDTTEESKFQKKIQQKHKMEALGTLAGGVAHDFNNILMPIIVNTEIALRDMDEANPVRDYLKLALDAAKRGRELVHQIISFSRPTPQEKETVEIASSVKETLKLLSSTLPTNIKIRQHIRTEFSSVLANPAQIYQILINLCRNAADAVGQKGGEIIVRVEDVCLDKDFNEKDPDLETNPYIKLAVSDTGCGMSEEVMDRIFDPFFSLKDKGARAGMGLTVVHGIVKDHGGFIKVRSAEGEGTVFEVFFPRVKVDSHEKKKEKVTLPEGDERILLIDDDETILQSLYNILGSLGYEVTTKSEGEAALKAFRAHPDSFDLIITDQVMPGTLGSDLSQEILSTRADIPIILFTGYDDRIDQEKIKEIGIKKLVLKPLNIFEIAQTVRQVLDDK